MTLNLGLGMLHLPVRASVLALVPYVQSELHRDAHSLSALHHCSNNIVKAVRIM